jgi:hypothetical protein
MSGSRIYYIQVIPNRLSPRPEEIINNESLNCDFFSSVCVCMCVCVRTIFDSQRNQGERLLIHN